MLKLYVRKNISLKTIYLKKHAIYISTYKTENKKFKSYNIMDIKEIDIGNITDIWYN